jgi:hypothetical protein
MSAIWSEPVELNNEIAGFGKQIRMPWGAATWLEDEPGVLSSRVAKTTMARIFAARMIGKEEVAAGTCPKCMNRRLARALAGFALSLFFF